MAIKTFGSLAFPATLSFFLISNTAAAQVYTIESPDGARENITLYYKPASGALTISHQRDTLLIKDFSSVDTVEVLGGRFLKISYTKRGGSNEGFGSQLILSVFQVRLCQSLHIDTYMNFDIRPKEYSLFRATTTLTGKKAETYRLLLNIHKERNNFSYNSTKTLAFDNKDNIFYNTHEKLSGYYRFHDSDKDAIQKRYLAKDVPVVTIGKDKYYYIDRDWYTKDKSNFYSMML